jgi:hypothetical protein
LLLGCQAPDAAPVESAAAEVTNAVDTEAPVLESEVAPEEPYEPWQVVKEMEIEHKPTFAAFSDELIGATDCGMDNYAPSFTADGGNSWVRPDTHDACPNNLDIVGAQSFWQCNAVAVNASRDGGQSLIYLSKPIGFCGLVNFLDDEVGWGASHTNLSVTKDGAKSWVEIALPEEVNDIAAISLRTAESGYLLDFDGTLYSTTDSGQSWSAQSLPIEDSDLEMMSLGRPSAAVRFLDENNGLLIANLAGGGKSEVIALHTADGGQSWEQHLLPVKLGAVYLSHDGQYLTISDMMERGKVTLLQQPVN